jgi:hypothetical protein
MPVQPSKYKWCLLRPPFLYLGEDLVFTETLGQQVGDLFDEISFLSREGEGDTEALGHVAQCGDGGIVLSRWIGNRLLRVDVKLEVGGANSGGGK